MPTSARITASMSRKGNCWGNAPMERLVTSLKAGLGVPVFESHAAARSQIFDYIERFYNRNRCHATLAYATSVAYEQRWWQQQMSA